MTEAISQQLKDLNSKRRFKAALLLYARRNQNNSEETDAHMHYQAALAALMLGEVITFIKARLNACPNYTSEMRGDLKRDIALSLVRHGGSLNDALGLIDQAMRLHEGSTVRLAVDNQAFARILEAQGDDVDAYNVIRQALDQLLRTSEPVSATFLANTAFHAVRLAVKNSYRARAHKALEIVIELDPSWKKRWAARAMYYLPAGLGVRIVARLP